MNIVEINSENNQKISTSKLIFLLINLSKKEQNALRKFLQSPYFNQRADVLVFFELILKYLNKDIELPSKEFFFQQIYPNQSFSDQNFRLLMSYLFKLAEQFLGTNARSFSEKSKKSKTKTRKITIPQ